MGVTLIAGPPASGKSTWARAHWRPGDLLLDWDDLLSALSGLAPYERPERVCRYANAATQAILTALRRDGRRALPRPDHSWVIRTAPRAEERLLHAAPLPFGLGARVVVIACPADVCHARIDADVSRIPTRAAQHEAVDDWWAQYVLSAADETIDSWTPQGASISATSSVEV